MQSPRGLDSRRKDHSQLLRSDGATASYCQRFWERKGHDWSSSSDCLVFPSAIYAVATRFATTSRSRTFDALHAANADGGSIPEEWRLVLECLVLGWFEAEQAGELWGARSMRTATLW